MQKKEIITALQDNDTFLITYYAKKHKNIMVYHHKENEGVSATRNTGLDNCHGDYITYVDSDDFLEPLTHGDMQLWIATEDKNLHSVMITQIIPYPQKQVLRVISLAGSDFKKLNQFQAMLIALFI